MENLTIVKDYSLINKKKIAYEWKIEEFLNLIYIYRNSNFDGIIQSTFHTNLTKWELHLKFNNIESANNKWISIYIYFYDTQIKFKCSLYLLDNEGKKKFTQKTSRLMKNGEYWEILEFLEINKLLEKKHELLHNNDLTIGIKFTEFINGCQKRIIVPSKSPGNQIISDLKYIFESKAGSDVVLLVGDKKILAHKLILTIRSPVFAAMFSHQLKENKENEITISDMDPEVCEKMLEYIYTDNVTGLDKIVEFLYEEADKYQLPALKELCEESFCRRIKIENAIKYLVLLDRHHADKKFFDYVSKFIVLNSKTIVTTADYKELEKTNPGLLLTITTMICSIN